VLPDGVYSIEPLSTLHNVTQVGLTAAWLCGLDVGRRPVDFPCPGGIYSVWLRGDYFLGRMYALGQPPRPTQPSIPPGLVNE